MADIGLRRLVKTVAIISVGVFVAVVISSVYFGPKIVATSDATQEVRDGTDLSSCRAIYSAAVADAQAALTEAKARLDVNTNESLRAATVAPDRARLTELLNQAPLLEAAVDKSIDHSAAQRAAYATAIDRALRDPKGFLTDCRNTHR